MHASIDELVHVIFTITMVEQLLRIDESLYQLCATTKLSKKVRYVELLKALHAAILAASPFWEKLISLLPE
jgi:hypothetical protein